MPSPIVREYNVTRVSFSLIVTHDGVPAFEPQPDAVFSGILSERRIKNALEKMLGPGVPYYITATDAGKHKFAMPFEEFIRNARVVDGEDIAEYDGEEDADGAKEDAAGDAEAAPEPHVAASQPTPAFTQQMSPGGYAAAPMGAAGAQPASVPQMAPDATVPPQATALGGSPYGSQPPTV